MKQIAFTYLGLLLTCAINANAQSIEVERAKLATISDFADKICPAPSLVGQTSIVDLSGSAKADLSKVTRKLVDLGVTGSAKYESGSYKNVLQQDLAALIKDSTTCRLKTVEMLFSKFFESPAANPKAVKKTREAPIAKKPSEAPFITGGSNRLKSRLDPSIKSGCRSLADSSNNPSEIVFVVQNATRGMRGRVVASVGRVEGLEPIDWVVDGPPILLNGVHMVNRSSIYLELTGAPPRTFATWNTPNPAECADHELHIDDIKIRFISGR